MSTAQAPPVPFADVFDAHFDAVHGYLRRRVGDVAEVRAWLFGIATNLVHGHRRSEARRLRAYIREAARTAPPATEIDAAGRLDAADQAARAAVAIPQLSRADRDVLLLTAWADLTFDAVAAALDVPVGTVRSRLHRARAAVRTHLEER